MAPEPHDLRRLSRRALLKNLASLGSTPLLLRPARLYGAAFLLAPPDRPLPPVPAFADLRLEPRYPARSPLEDVLRLVEPGSDEYTSEKYAFEIAAVLKRWSQAMQSGDLRAVKSSLDPSAQVAVFSPARETPVRTGYGIDVVRREFPQAVASATGRLLPELAAWLGRDAHVETAEFEITALEEVGAAPLRVSVQIRYDMVTTAGSHREESVGSWRMEWVRAGSADWTVARWQVEPEIRSRSQGPGFTDITPRAVGRVPSYREQLLRGADQWRTMLDGACGIDVYGNNGVAAGDYNNDGFDDLYICQPAGLPNRLYRNRGDGTFEDATDKAGVGVLDNTASALFADFRNCGLQDLLVVCGSGPLLFLNQGDGTFAHKPDAFHFAQPPQGSFTQAAIADYDRDGRLDIYFCLYSYYLGLDQYHYPVPYYDARNGPPNFLLHNEGNGIFVDHTEAAGLNIDNDRYSFAAAWGESASNNRPDLYVANDFGRNTFYRNRGDGTFTSASTAAHVEDVGAGMSATWADTDNDGHPDIYVANMWSAAGQRVSSQKLFHEKASANIRDFYQRHARGNALYRNRGDGTFRNASQPAGVEVGRWAWCSDFWDFDHDGYIDLYVTNGYITAPTQAANPGSDLGSFFWRQVVAKSPEDSTPSPAYEHGWNALNELIRSDSSWSGRERNVMFANNRDGSFSEVSGIVGLDCMEDSRSFALADLDHDGRLEVILKNRNAPQLRILHNDLAGIGDSLAFRLRGTRSNRDAIGTAITLECGELRQTRYLQAGTGFLAQHTKELFFGIGKAGNTATVRATVRWPSGLTQQYENLPRNHRITLEEGVATINATPFASVPAAVNNTALSSPPSPIPSQSEAWLLDPLKAPAFSLPDQHGSLQTLHAERGKFVVLYFWMSESAPSREQLKALQQYRAAFASAPLSVIAVNVDQGVNATQARTLTLQQGWSFPVLFATDEVAGTYNIINRYLFDRRRDLAIPTAFLIDPTGMIVKVYQGGVDPARLLADTRAAPATAADRLRMALPFAGKLYQGSFVRNDFTYGVAMFQHGYLDQAEESFQQVVLDKPENAEGYYNLGTLNLRKKDYKQARVYLEKTLKLRSNYPEAWNNLGMIAAQQNNPDEAIANFEQALSQRRDYAIALLNLGNTYRRQGTFAKAQTYLQQALDLEPGDPEANYSLGMFYAQQDQLQPAADYLQKAVALRPDYPEAINNLGVLFVRTQDYSSAEQQFVLCIRIDPAFEQSYVNLARLYVLQHEKAKARKALEDLQRLHPESATARQGLEMLNSMP